MKRLNKRRFRQWLRSHNPDEIVGIPSDPGRCPIATHLRQSEGWNDVHVSERRYTLADLQATHDFQTPHWAYRFIRAVDFYYFHKPGVTARQALYILNRH